MIDDEDPSIGLTVAICSLLDIDLRYPPPRTKPTLRAVRLAAVVVSSEVCVDLSIEPGASHDRALFTDPLHVLAGAAGEAHASGFRDYELVQGCDRSISRAWNLIRDHSGQGRLDRFAELLTEARWTVIQRWVRIETLAGALMDLRHIRAERVEEIIAHRSERGEEWRAICSASLAHVRPGRPGPRVVARVIPFQQKKVGS